MVTFKKGDIVEIVMIGIVSPHWKKNGSHKEYLHKPILIDRIHQVTDKNDKKYSNSFHFLDGHFVKDGGWICISPVMLKRCEK